MVMSPLLVMSALGEELSFPIRAGAVVCGIGVVLAGYRLDERVGGSPEAPLLPGRLLLAFAATGLAIGVYAAVEVGLLAGAVFVFGAYLFARIAYGEAS